MVGYENCRVRTWQCLNKVGYKRSGYECGGVQTWQGTNVVGKNMLGYKYGGVRMSRGMNVLKYCVTNLSHRLYNQG